MVLMVGCVVAHLATPDEPGRAIHLRSCIGARSCAPVSSTRLIARLRARASRSTQ